MRNFFIFFILLLPAGVISILLPLSDSVKVIFFVILFVLDMLFLFFFMKKGKLDIKENREIPKEIDSGQNLFGEIEISRENDSLSPEENDLPQKKYLQHLSDIKNELVYIKNHFQKQDPEVQKKELTSFTSEFLPAIEQARNESSTIEGNVSQIYNISDNLSKTAQQAFDLAEKVKNEINTVNKILNNAIHVTDVLSKKSIEISKILEIMSNLSSKVHVLSINASIVSARAGDHGKGFEVVAKEIRKLAEETDNSLQDIDEHVNDIQNAVDSVVIEIEQANTAINQEAETLIAVAGSLRGVLLAVEIVNTVSITAKDNTASQGSHFETMKSSLDLLLRHFEQLYTEKNNEINMCRDCLDKISIDMDSLRDEAGLF